MASREIAASSYDFAGNASFQNARISGEWLAILAACTCLLVATLLLKTGIVVRENAAFVMIFGLLGGLGLILLFGEPSHADQKWRTAAAR